MFACVRATPAPTHLSADVALAKTPGPSAAVLHLVVRARMWFHDTRQHHLRPDSKEDTFGEVCFRWLARTFVHVLHILIVEGDGVGGTFDIQYLVRRRLL